MVKMSLEVSQWHLMTASDSVVGPDQERNENDSGLDRKDDEPVWVQSLVDCPIFAAI